MALSFFEFFWKKTHRFFQRQTFLPSTKTRQVLQEELQLASDAVPCGPERVNHLDANAREALEILELTPWPKCHASWWVGPHGNEGFRSTTQKVGEKEGGQLEFLGFRRFLVGEMLQVAIVA